MRRRKRPEDYDYQGTVQVNESTGMKITKNPLKENWEQGFMKWIHLQSDGKICERKFQVSKSVEVWKLEGVWKEVAS